MSFAELDGVRIHYRIDGPENGPVLVLSNSLGTDLHMWDKVLPALAGRYRVLRYDTRGHGQSSVTAAPYSIRELAGDLLRLLDSLKLSHVDLCGLSLGGQTAIWLAIHEPSRFGRFAFANTAPKIGTAAGWDERIAAIRASGMAPLAQATMGRWFTSAFVEAHPEEIAVARAMVESTAAEGYIGCCMALRDEDLREQVGRIKARCLVIAGQSDVATTPADGLALHEKIAGSQIVALKAAHVSAWERPQEFAAAVLGFLT